MTSLKKSLLAVMAACAAGYLFSAQALTLGVTEGVTYRASDAEIEAKFVPIAKALSAATKEPVKIRVISSYSGLRDALKQGLLDVAFIHPAHVSFETIKTGAYKSAAWTIGFTDYKVSFLCNEPQPITAWTNVNGKGLVTPDADSITAVITRAMLREKAVDTKSVNLQITRFQDAVPFYVENKFASYGATASGAVIKSWKDKGGTTCAQSRGIPIKHWLVSNKLDATSATAIRESLLTMDQSEIGKKALAVSGYKGFIASDEATEKILTSWLGL
jgi:phosphonate transport system substrate-binding protein